jgi:hypothetical protein
MKKQATEKQIAGGSPSAGGPKGKTKQRDDSQKGAETLNSESVKKSEKGNMTGKKGYNETPPDVPVKSTKKA